jgi:hypothetical protein
LKQKNISDILITHACFRFSYVTENKFSAADCHRNRKLQNYRNGRNLFSLEVMM